MQKQNKEEKVTTNNKFTHDVFIKKAMGRREVAIEFFEANLPDYILNRIDLTTLKSEKTDFLDNALGNRAVDMLYSVKFGDHKNYITLLLEHQSTSQKEMTARIVLYTAHIWSVHMKNHPKLPLPIVYPTILYTGKKKYTAPRSFWNLFSDPELAKQCFIGDVKVVNLAEISSIDLTNKYHSGAVLQLMKIIHSKKLLPHLKEMLPVLQKLARKNFKLVQDMIYYTVENTDISEKKSVCEFFKQADTDEGNSMVSIADGFRAEGMEIGMQQGMLLGVRQGREEGVHQEKIAVARKLLAQGSDVKTICYLTDLREDDILKLKQPEFS